MSTISSGTTSTTTLIHSGDTTGSLVFKTNDTGSGGTTAVTIDTSQNVGIGTSSPSYKLEVSANGGQIAATSTGTNAAYLVARNTNVSGQFYFAIDNSAGNNFNTGTAYGRAIWSSGSYPIVFVTNSGSSTMTFDSSGNLLVKKTASSSSADNNVGAQLGASGKCIFEVSGDRALILNRLNDNGIIQEFFRGGGNQVGNIQANTSSVAYNTSSDYRLKEDIAPMTGALAKVSQLKPVTYKWKSDGEEGQGFIAHELQEVVPDCVTGEKDAVDADGKPVYQGIDTSFLVATLTAAIQEQQALITAQAETINALTARVAVLEGK